MAPSPLSLVLILLATLTLAAPHKRNPFIFLQKTRDENAIFNLGNITYLANTQYPKASLGGKGSSEGSNVPVAVIRTDAEVITREVLESTIVDYLERDDVFSEDWLEGVVVASGGEGAVMDETARDYLEAMDLKHLVLDSDLASGKMSEDITVVDIKGAADLPAGPYLASISSGSVSLSTVYRLYEDSYRDFLYGSYDLNNGGGNHTYLDYNLPSFRYPAIPVPSRLYSDADPRPLAGERVAIKDLFDIRGLKTTGGSRAWSSIISPAATNAPSIQRLLDLGAVLVGKYKLAQFASGANPWDWQDEHYPFNPRGDGWLTCSASSSGGGCAVAAYEWLDAAIGSDTGSSMRRPAAVSGTFGQRPSQGLMSLEGVMPLGGATDTAGVFSRDPRKWVKFSKAWYVPELHQPPNITGLSPLVVPDSEAWPKTLLYPTDYLPLNNSAAEAVLQAFITNLTTIFGMERVDFNFTATVQNVSDPTLNNFTTLTEPLGVINSYTQWEEVASPLINAWDEMYDGAFPPIDPARRQGWREYNESERTLGDYNDALAAKARAVDWWESTLQYETPDSCSNSLLIYDIGTGGFPSYRELPLNGPQNTSFLAVTPEGAGLSPASICPLYGCADFTVPIGEVSYKSSVTFVEEWVPVTVNLVVRRGCDFVLLNLVERLAEEGVVRGVGTGKRAFG